MRFAVDQRVNGFFTQNYPIMKPVCRILLGLLCHLGLVTLGFSQNQEIIVRNLQHYFVVHPQEKIHLHTDQAQYTLGARIGFKVYVREALNLHRSNNSNIAQVELLDPFGNILAQMNLDVSQGYGIGHFRLQQHWPRGTYVLRTYTSFQRNFDPQIAAQRKIQVNGLDNLDNAP
jgi:hypothetical protein